MSRILDKSFHYVPASKTDLRKTFAKERRRLRDEAARNAAMPDAEARVIRMKAIAKRAG